MEGDLNYYQSSYHGQASQSSAMKHPSTAADAYPRARQLPSGSSVGVPGSHHQAYSTEGPMAYGSRAPATSGQPLRKPMEGVGSNSGVPPSMLREYTYERSNPYEQGTFSRAPYFQQT